MAVKRWNGTSWEAYSGGPIPTSAIVTWKKTAVGGETTLSGNDDNLTSLAYTVGQEQVYVNGILQVRGSDYTAATGTSITFLQPLVNGSVQGLFAGDIVQIWCPTAFQVPSASATASQWRYIATGGETTLSGVDSVSTSLSYTVGQELVFQNGNLLYRGVDYTATTGTSIVLTNALIASDIVNVWSPNAFTVANAIPASTVTYKGDLIAATGSGTVTNLPAGTNGQYLKADSSASAGLSWTTFPTIGGMTLLSTTTLSTTTTTVSSIDGSYKHLFFLIRNFHANGSTLAFRTNGITGMHYYANTQTIGNGFAFSAAWSNGATEAQFNGNVTASNNNNCFGWIYDYSNSAVAFKPSFFTLYSDGNDKWAEIRWVNRGIGTSPISSITVFSPGGGTINGTLLIYGVN